MSKKSPVVEVEVRFVSGLVFSVGSLGGLVRYVLVWANIDTGGLFGFCLAPGYTSRRMVQNTFQFISNASTVTTIQIREFYIEQ